MEKNNMTAVKWLAKELEDYGNPQVCEINWEVLDALINQAKQMEKQQHNETWEIGRLEDKGDDYLGKQLSFEQYYNETYGERKQE